MKNRVSIFIAIVLFSHGVLADSLQLRVIETTDIHANVMDYDYYKDSPSERIGLVRVATLIKAAQAEVRNSVLVDNGDIIQGSPMGDRAASEGLAEGEVHPVYKAMNTLDYRVGNIGNHEFNYGLPFLMNAIAGADFPYINANVLDADNKEPLFDPYLIETRALVDESGETHEIKIGYIGFVPPQITVWDRKHLEGKVVTQDIVESARHWVPEMKAAGADVVIAIPHSGLSVEPYKTLAENSVYYLSKVEGIDAIAFGHAHAVFPSVDFADLPGVDLEAGTINGVPSVMPGYWGSHAGIIDLQLQRQDKRWHVASGRSEARPIFSTEEGRSLAEADPEMTEALSTDHTHTREFVNRPVGKADAPLYSYLALVQDDPTVQVVNDAQIDYVERHVQGDPDLASLPVLSAAAPFKAGGRSGSADNYVKVEAGALSFRHAADLYPFANTLVALKLSGAQIREWLECSASMYQRVEPGSADRQPLLNLVEFRSFNFDVIDGVNYQIDVTQPARYDSDCTLVDDQAHRIRQLTYQGEPVNDGQTFLLATNNFRAYGDRFPGTGGSTVAFDAPDENRSILIDYLGRLTEEGGVFSPGVDDNWHLVAPGGENPVPVVFHSAGTDEAKAHIRLQSRYPITPIERQGDAMLYQIELN